MQARPPIPVVHLFQPERAALLEILGDLSDAEWALPTACPGWTVKDVALHILGGDVGIVARKRDGFHVPLPDAETFVEALNRHNEQWVESTRRISPPQLIDLLAHVGPQVYATLEGLDLLALGPPVYWAGPDEAPIWLDVAREYTERWHHQQHIRDAVNCPGLLDHTFAAPVFETFAYALPWSFRDIAAPPGTTVELRISGAAGGRWWITREDAAWKRTVPKGSATSSVEIPPELAWKMFTGGLPADLCAAGSKLEGDRDLARSLFDTRAIIV